MNFIGNALRRSLWALISLFITGLFTVALIVLYLEARLPSTDSLKNVQMQIPLRVYTKDHELIGIFGEKRRIPVTIDEVPKPLIQAILATEDQRFFEHSGVDLFGLARAAFELVRTGSISQGGSTITMQVARNFFLSRQKTFTRKLREVLLAIKIDNTLSKQKILELYLNKIYFGARAYGVAAAAEVYFGKTLNQLSLSEMAMIAGLPKAPSTLNPIANPVAALERRNHVLSRMLTEHYINEAAYEKALSEPLAASFHQPQSTVKAPYAAEMVRQLMVERFGEDAYTQGYQVYTTIDNNLQMYANESLRDSVLGYEQRHGFRRPKVNLRHIPQGKQYVGWVNYLKPLHVLNGLRPAVVISVEDNAITALLANNEKITLPAADLAWLKNFGSIRSLIKSGDVIRVVLQRNGNWGLAQIPQIEGALVALDPNDGAIRAISGGFDFSNSNFNRAVQAKRQAGSSFKPFIYSAALEKGFTLASVVNDAPVVINDPSLPHLWRPQNDDKKFYGPTRLRVALAHSINLVSIRLLQAIGIRYTVDYVKRFGFKKEQLPAGLSLALGTASVTPLQMATGFATFANGGYKVSPYVIQRITDNAGNTILLANPKLACEDCRNPAKAVITPQNAYIMTSALQGVIQTGTGHAAAEKLKRKDIAGKTGTSDDQRDAWFVGFNRDLVVASWMGYDQERSTHEHGAQAALPMWIEFMDLALTGKPETVYNEPEGIARAKIDPETGLLADDGDPDAVEEVFRQDEISKLTTPSYPGAAWLQGGDDSQNDDSDTDVANDNGNLF